MGNTVAVNQPPPKWYVAWLRTEISSLALIISFVWIAVFVVEQRWAIVPGNDLEPDVYTNTALGALDLTSVSRGGWWRFFTNPFLHGGPNHLQWDILALLGVGPTFQALVGRAWFGATFVLVALVSGGISLLTTPVYPGTIGPMGVVMGILAANFVCGFHFEKEIRLRAWQASGVSLIAALWQTSQHQSFPVDIGGHISGMIAGGLMGCGLLVSWPRDRPKPSFETAARLTSWCFILAAIIAFSIVMLHYPSYVQKIKQTIPATELDAAHIKNTLAKSEEYVTRYPEDPWAHHLRGQYFLAQKNYVDAEGEFRTALRLATDWPFGPDKVDIERVMLALTLWYQGRVQDAQQIAQPSCNSQNPESHFRGLMKVLWSGHICGAN